MKIGVDFKWHLGYYSVSVREKTQIKRVKQTREKLIWLIKQDVMVFLRRTTTHPTLARQQATKLSAEQSMKRIIRMTLKVGAALNTASPSLKKYPVG
jgi:predicted ribosome-associated RNA-binding protein Tma20